MHAAQRWEPPAGRVAHVQLAIARTQEHRTPMRWRSCLASAWRRHRRVRACEPAPLSLLRTAQAYAASVRQPPHLASGALGLQDPTAATPWPLTQTCRRTPCGPAPAAGPVRPGAGCRNSAHTRRPGSPAHRCRRTSRTQQRSCRRCGTAARLHASAAHALSGPAEAPTGQQAVRAAHPGQCLRPAVRCVVVVGVQQAHVCDCQQVLTRALQQHRHP